MAQPTAVILVVGLNRSLIGDHSPHLRAFANQGQVHQLQPVLPAVTCSVQTSMLTGRPPGGPEGHGIVGNGYYNRELAEVHFWKQSHHLVQGDSVWDAAKKRDPSFTCANLFWWYNMYSSVDYSVTPRPIYKADGRKLPDVYTEPMQLRHELQDRFGTFPLFHFWGPASSIRSSQWIGDAAMYLYDQHQPTLNLVYLPHLDYALQKFGPDHANITGAVSEVDQVVGQLIDYYQQRSVRVIILSEYGIETVDDAVAINLVLREAGLLRTRQEQGLELLDAGASDAFAVADHQVAHVYVKASRSISPIAELCRKTPGVEQVLNRQDQKHLCLDHRRSGDLMLVADTRHWFSYRYWQNEACAPDFARTVDIHRKPGYDPLELFVNPSLKFPKLYIGWQLLKRKAGLRSLLDVIPLDTALVNGSHGRIQQPRDMAPILITQHNQKELPDLIPCQDVRRIILDHLFLA